MGDASLPGLSKAVDHPTSDEIRSLMDRASKGDETVLPALCRVFDRDRTYIEAMNVAQSARTAVIKLMAGKNVAVHELLNRRMDEVANELAGPDPTPIERLLADRAAFCWHLVNAYERTYASADGLSIRQADYHQRRLDAAHKRYLSSLKTLATVRKLAVPTLQINLAQQQVNVAGNG